jgi:cytosine/creatinine deaminase
MDLIIKNAKLFQKEGLFDIGIENGIITKLSKKISEKAKKTIDADSNLVIPTLVDPHVHLDKALISEVVRKNETGTLMEAIEIIWEKKRNYKIEDIKKRAKRVIGWAIQNGTTIMRTHVDVDTIGLLKPAKALLEVKREVQDFFDLQIVAFPQEGILKDPGTEELLEQSLKLGCDVIGGMPYNEYTDDDSKKHIDIVFSLAKKYNADIDMHVDETDDFNARTLQYLAAKTIKEKYFGRVTAGHTCALAAYNDYYAAKVISMLKTAKINMITNPATNLMLEGRLDKQPIRRGITRVKELLSAGVNVCYGQDCLKDTFYPTFGQADMFEVGLILAHAAQFSMPNEIDSLFMMPTYNSAKTLNIKNYGIEIGYKASMNILKVDSVQEAFRIQPDRIVIKNGEVIAETNTKKDLKINL